MPLEDAETALAARKPGSVPAFEIWEENMQAFEIFCVLQTQWHRASGLAGAVRTGLMYAEARGEMTERSIGRKRRLELMESLRVMERAALQEWNKPSDG